MMPDHGVEPQINPSKFHHFVLHNNGTYRFGPGEKINFSLFVPGPEPVTHFKGFFIQARNNNDTIVGHFESTDTEVKTIDCDHENEHSAITHTDNSAKTRINATWIAPNQVSKITQDYLLIRLI